MSLVIATIFQVDSRRPGADDFTHSIRQLLRASTESTLEIDGQGNGYAPCNAPRGSHKLFPRYALAIGIAERP